MNITLKPGLYVAAVSGGVDSMVLLDLLRQRPGVKLIVAHYDHGMRDDSHLDRKLVQKFAKQNGLNFVYANGKLGKGASESKARDARYKFLKKTAKASGAVAIITAHHQDDLLETAILNLMRGSGRRGLTSLKSTDGILRPLLGYPKDQLLDYAHYHKIPWREDPTNQDTKYRRNYVRHNLLTKLTPGQRAELVILLEQLADTNQRFDDEIELLLHTQPAVNVLDRHFFITLPHDLSLEILLAWLRRFDVRDITRNRLERLVTAMKTGRPGQKADVDNTYYLDINKSQLALKHRDR